MLTRVTLFVVLLVVQGSAASAAARTSSLEPIWQRPLPAGQKHTIYRAAVCPDGTAFAVNSRGEVTGFDGTGTLIVETVHPDVFDTTAAACDESNRDGALDFMDVRPSGGRLVRARLVAAE